MMITTNPLHLARYGHSAAKLRAFLEERGMSVVDLNVALGMDRSYSLSYLWTAARNAPPGHIRAKLSEVTGIPEEDLKPREVDASPFRKARKAQRRKARKAQQQGALGWDDEPKPVPPEAWSRPKPTAKPVSAPHVQAAGTSLAFVVSADGTARVTLDVTLPLAKATRLLQHLLQAGIVDNDEAGVAE